MAYFYKIKNVQTNQYYVGSRYAKDADPSLFWKDYHTSSKLVLELISKYGKDSFLICRIEERSDARIYESKYLQYVYKRLGKSKFMELMLNRNLAPGILNTKESIDKANIKRKISNSIAAKKLFKEGRHNFQLNNASKLLHNRQMHSKRMLGNTLGSLRKITDEYRKKQAECTKGNTNVRGTVWVINSEGKKKRVLPNNIPEGFVRLCRI